MSISFLNDRAAILLSTACIVHCALLPLLAITFPFLAAFAEAEWVHWIMAFFAVMASTAVLIAAPSARVPTFLLPAGIGGFLILGGLMAERFDLNETLPTIVGGILIAAAHIGRLAHHR